MSKRSRGSQLPRSNLSVACRRCRSRKIRCDLSAPQCGNCSRADVQCVSSMLVSSRAASSLPPGYLESLETEVARLEAEVTRHSASANASLSPAHGAGNSSRSTFESPASTSSDITSLSPESRVPSMAFDWGVIGEADSGTLHPHLAYGMKEMIRSALAVDNTCPYRSGQPNPLSFKTGERSSVRESISHLRLVVYLQSYLDSVQSCLPFMAASSLSEQMQRLQTEETAHHLPPEVYLVLAIGALLDRKQEPVGAFHAVLLFEHSVERLDSLPSSSSPQTLQFLLLAIIFSLYSPMGGSSWHLHGLATQVSITLGLHQGRGSPTQLQDWPERETAFWVVYILSSLVSTPLGRPLSLVNEDITTEPPREHKTPLYYLFVLARTVALQIDAIGNPREELDTEARAIFDDLRENEGIEMSKWGIYRSLAFQLATFATTGPSLLRQISSMQAPDLTHHVRIYQAWLSHFHSAVVERNEAVMWTAAYAVFTAGILQDCIAQMQLSPAIPTDTFRGLERLVVIYRNSSDGDKGSQQKQDTLEAIPSDVTRMIVRMARTLHSRSVSGILAT